MLKKSLKVINQAVIDVKNKAEVDALQAILSEAEANGIPVLDCMQSPIITENGLVVPEGYDLNVIPTGSGKGDTATVDDVLLALIPSFDIVIESKLGRAFAENAVARLIRAKMIEGHRASKQNNALYKCPNNLEDFFKKATNGFVGVGKADFDEIIKATVVNLVAHLKATKKDELAKAVTNKNIKLAFESKAYADAQFSYLNTKGDKFVQWLNSARESFVAKGIATGYIDNLLATRDAVVDSVDVDDMDLDFNF